MGLVKYNSKNKHCGNCEYWVGDRSVEPNQEFVMVNPDEKGKCFGNYKNSNKKAKEQFSCWQRWLLLNENASSENIIAEINDLLKYEILG